MAPQETSPTRLALQLAIYFAVLISLIIVIIQIRPDVLQHLPIGGTDALDSSAISDIQDTLSAGSADTESAQRTITSDEEALQRVTRISLFVIGHLSGTILIMMPITWTYKAIQYRAGFNKNFVRALIVLPICATTTVLLIQNSLALAFGLAALVAAVRFRVSLDEAIDGIFIFAAVCVGLAAGIGYIGIAAIMSIFFCFSNLVLWKIDYGRNPVDDARRKKKRAKLDLHQSDRGVPPQ